MREERLARRAAEGDPKAFAAIYRRYHQALYRFCLTIVRDPQDAQDALQNTMVKALRALPGETRAIRLKPWLYRVAHNEAIEVLRRRRESVELDPELAGASTGPSETAATRERLRHLLDDIGELPERQRSALVMREVVGLGFGEIGAALETSEGAARQAVYEARLGLRQMEAGREMRCKDVMWDLSLADGRVTRRREIQAHLRTCPECRAFRDEIAKRRDDFAALAPLPLAASAGLLQGVLGAAAGSAGAGTGAGGSLAGAAAVGIGKSATLKAAATVAILAAGVTAADRGGLVEVPLPSDNGGVQSSAPTPGAPATGQGQSEGGGEAGAREGGRGERGGGEGSGAGVESRSEPAQGASSQEAPQGRIGRQGNPGDPRGKAKGHGSRGGGSPTALAHKKGAGSQPSAGKGKGRDKEPPAKAVGKPSVPPKGTPPPAANTKPKAEPPSVQKPEVEADKTASAPFQQPKPEVDGASP